MEGSEITLVRGGQAVTSNAPSLEHQNILIVNHGRQVYVPGDRIPTPTILLARAEAA